MLRIALLLAVVGSLAVALAANGTAAPVRLTATVGPGCTITLKKGTKVVRTLKRGKYRLRPARRPDARQLPRHLARNPGRGRVAGPA